MDDIHYKILKDITSIVKAVSRNQVEQAKVNQKLLKFAVDIVPNIIFEQYELSDEDSEGPDDDGVESYGGSE